MDDYFCKQSRPIKVFQWKQFGDYAKDKIR